jgi:hypothetical protein
MPLGYQGRIEHSDQPGEIAEFTVTVRLSETQLLVESTPEVGLHIWGQPTVCLHSADVHRLKFINFFDWYETGPRDFGLLKVMIQELETQPELIGKHALIEFRACQIWMEEVEGQRPVLP